MRQSFFLVLILTGLAQNVLSQPITCCCDYVINKAGMYRLSMVQPGQTVCVQSGHYEWLRFLDLMGAPGKPIRIVNYGGQVTVGGTSYYAGMQFYNDRYFTLTGTGDAQYTYGFKFTETGTNGNALNISGKSSDCEVTGVEVAKAGFAGIMIKTDPSCDSTTWRNAFTMYNVDVHHNYVHDVAGEGFYIGNSFWSGQTITCNGTSRVVYPHAIVGLSIHHNVVERSGAEGIQYACAPDAQVHHNDVRNTGVSPFSNHQDNGIQIGGGAGGAFYNNFIQHAPSNGLIIIGHLGNNLIYNNIIADSGENGIFCDDRDGSLPNTYVAFVNNTLVRSGQDGIKLYNQNNTITIDNNAILSIGAARQYVSYGQGATATPRNNYTASDVATARFVDPAEGNFRLRVGSPLIDAGRGVSSWGITVDAADQPRPQNSLYDIGAYEFTSSVASSGKPVAIGTAQAVRFESNCTQWNVINPELTAGLVTGVETETAPILRPKVYPSPSTTHIDIEPSGYESPKDLALYDGQGQLHPLTVSLTKPVTRLDLKALPPGVYFVRFRIGEQWFTRRFVKQ